MARALLVLILLATHAAWATGLDVPQGTTQWDTGSVCQLGRSGKNCSEYEATLTMWNVDGEICGSISETSVRRSPEAWFRGRPYEEGILVQYVESFQDNPADYGWAVIKLGKDRLEWMVLKSPLGSYIGNEARFRPAKDAETAHAAAGSCSELENERSGLTVRLPPEQPIDVRTR